MGGGIDTASLVRVASALSAIEYVRTANVVSNCGATRPSTPAMRALIPMSARAALRTLVNRAFSSSSSIAVRSAAQISSAPAHWKNTAGFSGTTAGTVAGCSVLPEACSCAGDGIRRLRGGGAGGPEPGVRCGASARPSLDGGVAGGVALSGGDEGRREGGDRKSTRLNSSHSQISYAVFCLKKKKKDRSTHGRRKTPPHM